MGMFLCLPSPSGIFHVPPLSSSISAFSWSSMQVHRNTHGHYPQQGLMPLLAKISPRDIRRLGAAVSFTYISSTLRISKRIIDDNPFSVLWLSMPSSSLSTCIVYIFDFYFNYTSRLDCFRPFPKALYTLSVMKFNWRNILCTGHLSFYLYPLNPNKSSVFNIAWKKCRINRPFPKTKAIYSAIISGHPFHHLLLTATIEQAFLKGDNNNVNRSPREEGESDRDSFLRCDEHSHDSIKRHLLHHTIEYLSLWIEGFPQLGGSPN